MPRFPLDDVNLSIGDGEIMVHVGPSGCGKTTALRMVAGLEDVSEGAIEIDGRDVTEMPPAAFPEPPGIRGER